MKIRQGFVSNSSSSSFVLIVTKEGHEKALEQLNVYQRDVVNEVMSKDTLFGHEVLVFGEFNVQDYSVTWDYFNMKWKDEYEGLDGDGPSEAFYDYRQKLSKEAVVFSFSMDG